MTTTIRGGGKWIWLDFGVGWKDEVMLVFRTRSWMRSGDFWSKSYIFRMGKGFWKLEKKIFIRIGFFYKNNKFRSEKLRKNFFFQILTKIDFSARKKIHSDLRKNWKKNFFKIYFCFFFSVPNSTNISKKFLCYSFYT